MTTDEEISSKILKEWQEEEFTWATPQMIADEQGQLLRLVTFTRVNLAKCLQDLINIQCSNGNWNYDPYMHGMANGLICALATINGKEAQYMEAPSEWLKDRVVVPEVVEGSI